MSLGGTPVPVCTDSAVVPEPPLQPESPEPEEPPTQQDVGPALIRRMVMVIGISREKPVKQRPPAKNSSSISSNTSPG